MTNNNNKDKQDRRLPPINPVPKREIDTGRKKRIVVYEETQPKHVIIKDEKTSK